MLTESILRWLIPRPPAADAGPPIPPGITPYQGEHEGRAVRYHLRVEPDGQALLLVDAAAAVRLSPVGALMADRQLRGQDDATIAAEVADLYAGASSADIEADVRELRALVQRLVSAPGGTFPLTNLGEVTDARTGQFMAPLQADLPAAEPDRLRPLLGRLWEVGVPIVTLRDQPDARAEWLVQGVERAEDLGMITQLRSDTIRLRQEDLLDELAVAGLDCLVLPMGSTGASDHDAVWGAGSYGAMRALIGRAAERELAVVVELPLLSTAPVELDAAAEVLEEMGVAGASLWALVTPDEGPDESTEEEAVPSGDTDRSTVSMTQHGVPDPLLASQLVPVAVAVEELAEATPVPVLLQPPVRHDPARKLVDELMAGPRCSGDVAIRVEADGAVIPPRGPHRATGNLLRDPWEQIWDAPAFREYRQRLGQAARCDTCADLAQCAVICPRDPAGWTQGDGEVTP